MKNIFTISEFARLRNLNINSLRYYEKIGILKPAFTDPDTKYRYYTPEQLLILDIIILCVNFGIPLKEWTAYINEDGSLNMQALLLRSKSLAHAQIRKIREDLSLIDHLLDSIERSADDAPPSVSYEKRLQERRIITAEWFSTPPDAKQAERDIAALYTAAQKQGLFPVLLPGLLSRCRKGGTMECCLFLEVLNGRNQPGVRVLPGGSYLCTQFQMEPGTEVDTVIRRTFGTEEDALVAVCPLHQEACSFQVKPCELQKYLGPAEEPYAHL